jgi:hypothetical protein
LTKAYKAQEVAEAGSLLERVERLYKLTESIVAVTYRNQEWPTALAALRECRGHLELLGRISKELETAITINLVTSPEWEDLRTRLLLALEPHPEVRGRVLMAIEGGVSDSA